MPRPELRTLLSDITRSRVAVVGDFSLDAYWLMDASTSETSLETGLPTRPVRDQRYAPGGAANVAANLSDLGVTRIHAIGVIGHDPFGWYLSDLLNRMDVDTVGLVRQDTDWSTQVFCKPHTGDSEEERIDFGNFNTLDDTTARRLLRELIRTIPLVDVVVLNQQAFSSIHSSPYFREGLRDVIRTHSSITFVLDSRQYSDEYAGTIRKLNEREARRILAEMQRAQVTSSTEEVARSLLARWGMPVVVTSGPMGCAVCDKDGVAHIPAIASSGPVDPVGAGDSMLAGIAAALAAGHTIQTGAWLGTLAAGVTVRKLRQTGTATPDEILSLAQ